MFRDLVYKVLALMFFLAVIIYFALDKEVTKQEEQISKDLASTPQKQSIQASAVTAPLVPPPFKLDHEFKTVQGRTWRDRDEAIGTVNQVFKFLVQVRNSPELNTEDDRAVWSLIEGYASKTKPLRYGLDSSPKGSWYSARYSCSKKVYFIGTNYLTVTELAMVMYHEMVHEVDCVKNATSSYATKGEKICRFEEHGYAANVRLMLALKRHKLLPNQIHGELGRQNSMAVILEAWPEIARGTFCAWLKDMYQNLQ